jgi:hypothetical protein
MTTEKDNQADERTQVKLTGWEAIEAKEADESVVLCKYSDPAEDARENLSAEEAREIAKQDQSLIYAPAGADERTHEPEIIDCGGAYEVHTTRGGGWAVVNGDTGMVRSNYPDRDEAVQAAEQLNEGQ